MGVGKVSVVPVVPVSGVWSCGFGLRLNFGNLRKQVMLGSARLVYKQHSSRRHASSLSNKTMFF